jgi:Spy/CpxP family protein refolding chaperone
MNKRKYFLIGGLVVVLGIGVMASYAAAQGNLARARAQVRLARLIGVRGFANKLNLTADQKAQIKAILQNNKTQIQQAARNVIKARLDLVKGYDGAAGELVAAQSQAAGLRKQIFDSVKPILTQDQLSKMQQLQQMRGQRLQRMLDRLNSRIVN